MQLYKSRTFGAYFSDTFTFLKENGKHFYKNYFIVNGLFILILLALTFFFSRYYLDFIFADSFSAEYQDSPGVFAKGNEFLLLVFFFIFFVVAACVAIINYAYTPIYFKLYDKNSGAYFSKDEIFNQLKSNLGKIFLFLLAGVLIAIPIFLVVFIAVAVLAVTIIGIPLIIIPLAWLTQFYFIAFMEYLQSEKGIFDCFSYSFTMSFKNFGATNGSVALFYLMIQVVQGILTMIPYILGIGAIFVGSSDYTGAGNEGLSTTFTTMIVFIYMLSFFLNLFLMTVLQTNQSIIYYSLKEETENIHTSSTIDEIGNF
ncbi:hypothetical protein HX109_08435 [Galbibacter sp. BG1]|uniref:hypothetical protein n=1 Tax=Galbibacter sp. BG1 TaxID=1170699 RepID=UPI0015BDFD8F|nr:hypothetical protein [Galbibacter sp. BG1]QLE01590.1 hypothetical protein HX109_08435 [Galbibacter sp. BG1]